MDNLTKSWWKPEKWENNSWDWINPLFWLISSTLIWLLNRWKKSDQKSIWYLSQCINKFWNDSPISQLAKEILENHDINLQDPKYEKQTLLHYIAKKHWCDSLLSELLNEKDIDVNLIDNNGFTPFIVAIIHWTINNIKHFIQSWKIDPNSLNNWWNLPPLFIWMQKTTWKYTNIQYLLSSENINKHFQILIDNKSKPISNIYIESGDDDKLREIFTQNDHLDDSIDFLENIFRSENFWEDILDKYRELIKIAKIVQSYLLFLILSYYYPFILANQKISDKTDILDQGWFTIYYKNNSNQETISTMNIFELRTKTIYFHSFLEDLIKNSESQWIIPIMDQKKLLLDNAKLLFDYYYSIELPTLAQNYDLNRLIRLYKNPLSDFELKEFNSPWTVNKKPHSYKIDESDPKYTLWEKRKKITNSISLRIIWEYKKRRSQLSSNFWKIIELIEANKKDELSNEDYGNMLWFLNQSDLIWMFDFEKLWNCFNENTQTNKRQQKQFDNIVSKLKTWQHWIKTLLNNKKLPESVYKFIQESIIMGFQKKWGLLNSEIYERIHRLLDDTKIPDSRLWVNSIKPMLTLFSGNEFTWKISKLDEDNWIRPFFSKNDRSKLFSYLNDEEYKIFQDMIKTDKSWFENFIDPTMFWLWFWFSTTNKYLIFKPLKHIASTKWWLRIIDWLIENNDIDLTPRDFLTILIKWYEGSKSLNKLLHSIWYEYDTTWKWDINMIDKYWNNIFHYLAKKWWQSFMIQRIIKMFPEANIESKNKKNESVLDITLKHWNIIDLMDISRLLNNNWTIDEETTLKTILYTIDTLDYNKMMFLLSTLKWASIEWKSKINNIYIKIAEKVLLQIINKWLDRNTIIPDNIQPFIDFCFFDLLKIYYKDDVDIVKITDCLADFSVSSQTIAIKSDRDWSKDIINNIPDCNPATNYINTTDNKWRTLLNILATKPWWHIFIPTLKSRLANPNIPDNNWNSPLVNALRMCKDSTYWLLSFKDIDVNKPWKDNIPIIIDLIRKMDFFTINQIMNSMKFRWLPIDHDYKDIKTIWQISIEIADLKRKWMSFMKKNIVAYPHIITDEISRIQKEISTKKITADHNLIPLFIFTQLLKYNDGLLYDINELTIEMVIDIIPVLNSSWIWDNISFESKLDKRLLEIILKKIDISSFNEKNISVLRMFFYDFISIIFKDDSGMLFLIDNISKTWDINSQKKNWHTLAHKLALTPYWHIFLKILMENPEFNINKPDVIWFTPIYFARRNRNQATIDLIKWSNKYDADMHDKRWIPYIFKLLTPWDSWAIISICEELWSNIMAKNQAWQTIFHILRSSIIKHIRHELEQKIITKEQFAMNRFYNNLRKYAKSKGHSIEDITSIRQKVKERIRKEEMGRKNMVQKPTKETKNSVNNDTTKPVKNGTIVKWKLVMWWKRVAFKNPFSQKK